MGAAPGAAGVVRSLTALIAVGIHWQGQRQVLALELVSRENQSAWREFFVPLKERGLPGVERDLRDCGPTSPPPLSIQTQRGPIILLSLSAEGAPCTDSSLPLASL